MAGVEKYGRIYQVKGSFLCQPCQRKGLVVQIVSVSHMTPKSQGGTDEEINLECICDPCHLIKTATERQ